MLWTGRYQPPHVGHELILRRSLSVWSEPHICAVVWSLSDPWDSQQVRRNLKHMPSVNPFSVWERIRLLELLIAGAGVDKTRVRIISVPRSDIAGRRMSDFLPRRYCKCTTNKDDEDAMNTDRWRREGHSTRILDVSDIAVPSATQLKRTLQAGGDWRPLIPVACHDYFVSIDGPARARAADVFHEKK